MEKLSYLSLSLNHYSKSNISNQNSQIYLQCRTCKKSYTETNLNLLNNRNSDILIYQCTECNQEINPYQIKNTESSLNDNNKEHLGKQLKIDTQINCIYFGCNELINKSDFNNHFLKCTHRSINCNNCLSMIKIKDISYHDEYVCPINKKKCKCGEIFKSDIYDNHIKDCAIYNIDHPNIPHLCKKNRMCND